MLASKAGRLAGQLEAGPVGVQLPLAMRKSYGYVRKTVFFCGRMFLHAVPVFCRLVMFTR